MRLATLTIFMLIPCTCLLAQTVTEPIQEKEKLATEYITYTYDTLTQKLDLAIAMYASKEPEEKKLASKRMFEMIAYYERLKRDYTSDSLLPVFSLKFYDKAITLTRNLRSIKWSMVLINDRNNYYGDPSAHACYGKNCMECDENN